MKTHCSRHTAPVAQRRAKAPSFYAWLLAGALLWPVGVRAAGVTIITHGWNPSSSAPAWMASLRDDIAANFLGGAQNYGTITVTKPAGSLVATCSPWNVDLSGGTNSDILILLDWSAVANHLTGGPTAQAVAAVVIDKLVTGQNGQRPLAELPIHLIGHSRGGGMVCELARLLGERGIVVDQLTPLDPHPLTASDPQPSFPFPAVIDTPAAIYQNVVFADVYSQTGEYPTGQSITGGYNRQWSALPGGYYNNSSPNNVYAAHRNILLLYQGTVNLAIPLSNGEATMGVTERAAWYNAYENSGDNTGFTYSRLDGAGNWTSTNTPVAGGDAIRAGLNNASVFGGGGSRSSLTWSAAVWPNVAQLDVLTNGTALGSGTYSVTVGTTQQVRYVYLDYDSGCTVTLRLDTDRNPYNNNDVGVISTQVVASATGGAYVQNTVNWNTAGLTNGTTVYVYAQVTDGTRTRYFYAAPTLQFVRVPLSPLVVITNPPGDLGVAYTTTAFTLGGTNNAAVTGTQWWTNTLNAANGTFAAASPWTIPGIPLAVGANPLRVYGTNSAGVQTNAAVTITRASAPPAPLVVITNPPGDLNVAYATTAITLGGTNNASVTGTQWWTNTLNAANGVFAAASPWTVVNIPLAVGTNTLLVYGTNSIGALTNAAVTVTRAAAPPLNTVWFVDASRPDDSGDGASWATAKRTIQAAVDTAGTNHLVWVTNGVYATGGVTNASPAISNRVCLTKSITVQSVNGPSVTFIKGAADPSTGGLGTNATRCVYMSAGLLAGFTLTNGYTRTDSDWNMQQGGGGALLRGGVISNCVVTACVSSHFAGGLDLFGGDAWNCIVAGNSSYDGGGLMLEGSRAFNCLIRGNNATHYGGGAYFWQSGLLANCTVAGNTATTNAGGVYCYQGGTNLNTIIYSNTVAGAVTNWVTNAGGGFVSSCTIPAASGTGNLTNNPLFVNLTAGDCRLQSGSPCVNAGTNQAWMSGAVDLDGRPRILAGRVDIGAYEWVGAPLVNITNANATVYGETASYTVSGTNNAFVMGTMWWTNQATTDQGTLAAASAWSIVNVPLAFGTNTITVSGTNEIGTVASDTLTITRLREFGDPSATHYVSSAGSHTWPYTNWLTAATNIQDAVDTASAGATVLVADGLYVTGGAVTPSPSYNVHLQSRVCVTRAVTVRSVDGPARTFIVGAADPVKTNGPAAMRCVYLTNGAVLSGFTLTNGHTTPSCNGPTCNYIYYSQNHAGGGAFLDGGGLVTNCVVIGCTVPNGQAGAESGSSPVYENGGGIYLNGGGTVVDSVIRDNVAGASGGGVGGSNGQVSRCLVTNNVTSSSSGSGGGVSLSGGSVSDSVITANFARSGGGLVLGGQTGWATNCLIVGNAAGEYGGGLSVGVLTGAVYNCTIAGNTSGSTAGGIYLANQRLVTVFNSIIYGNTAAYSPNISTNSYTTFAFVCTILPAVSGTGCFTNDPAFVNQGAGDYHLSAGSPCRNAGSNQGWMTNRTDLEGRARILEGTVDLGVYEFDPSHPPALVLNASAGAHGRITPDGNVPVPSGGTTNFTITPDTYYHVADVTTNGVSVGAASTFTWSNITANGTIAATFAPDLAANGTPHWWLAQYGWTNNFDTAEASDTDHDGFTAGQEYVADTNPTNAASYFHLTSVSNFPPWTVYFGSSSNRLYTLYSRTNLTEGIWLPVPGQSNVVGTGGSMSLTDTNAAAASFYRVNVALP